MISKVRAVLFCSVVVLGRMAFGQTTNVFPSTGNVGVGTTSPSRPLVVQGSDPQIMAAGASGTDAQIALAPSGLPTWSAYGSNLGYFYLRNLVAGTFPFVVAPNAPANALVLAGGNVGINVALPQVALDVNGSIHATNSIAAGGSYFNCLSYALNGTPTYGIKIKTQIPFQDSGEMPAVFIEGYNYSQAKTIAITLGWYVYNNSFYAPAASSFGGYAPQIKLSNENGYIVIFINDQQYFTRFGVRAFAKGLSGNQTWFSNWTTADEPLGGTSTISLSYDNGKGFFSGDVGVGTTAPRQRFEVSGSPASDFKTPIAAITSTNLPASGRWALAMGPYYGGYFAEIGFEKRYNNLAAHTGDLFFATSPYDSSAYAAPLERMRVTNEGYVGIGTSTPCATAAPASCKLSVNGSIQAKEVVVNTGWSDYVFDPGYRLRPLSEVAEYVGANHHLPEIPSAAEVQASGISLGDMQSKLLAKIEELTLHMIAAEKRSEELERRNVELVRRMTEVELTAGGKR